MSIAKTVVGRPTTFLIIFILLVGIGMYSASDLTIDLYPDIDIPMLVVNCSNTGSGPLEIENQITRPLESVLGSVSDIRDITSISSDGNSMLMLAFNWHNMSSHE